MKRKVVLIIGLLLCTLISMSQNVGVKTSTPQASLDVNGRIKVGDELSIPQAGTIRWNASTIDFEGYDGSNWMSLTSKTISNGGWGTISVNEKATKFATDFLDLDQYGKAIAMDGNIALIGSSKMINGNNYQGKVYVLEYNNGAWEEQAAFTASDGAAYNFFGSSISISGNYAVVGAARANNNRGKAYVFEKVGEDWYQRAILTASDGIEEDGFGFSVSINGDYITIGAINADFAGNNEQGKAYIFMRNGTNWTEQAILTASDGTALDRFGTSVSSYGDYVLIGAYSKLIGTIRTGKAYIFKRNGSVWQQEASLVPSGGTNNTGQNFGISASMYQDYAIVGASGKTVDNKEEQGMAFVYVRSGTIWTQQTALSASDGAATDHFGRSIRLHGNTVVIGAPDKEIGAVKKKGKAYVFVRNGNNWVQQAMLVASNGALEDNFGLEVSVFNNNIIVGAPLKDLEVLGFFGPVTFANAGMIYFFRKD